MNYKIVTLISAIIIAALSFYSCSDDSNSPSDNDYTLTQNDLDNADNILIESITGDEYGDVAIPHGGENLTADETIREVLGNLSSLSEKVNVGSIITKRTYLKDNNGDKGDLLVTFAMVKRKEGTFPAGGDWDYYVMPNDGSVDYDENPNGLIVNAANSGSIQSCADCHAAGGSDYLFVK